MGFFTDMMEALTEEEKIEAKMTAEEAEQQREEYMNREFSTVRTRTEGQPESERYYDSLETALRNIRDDGQKLLVVNGEVFRVQFLYTEGRV